jgi:hypothetical protein
MRFLSKNIWVFEKEDEETLVNTGKIYRKRRQRGVEPATMVMGLLLAHQDHSNTYLEIPVYNHCISLSSLPLNKVVFQEHSGTSNRGQVLLFWYVSARGSLVLFKTK